ncbi:hypothetical protein [Candidatus Methanocrinis natronophilus]|uniref:Resolvase/invertase-type recombinase catalytic domain-containing protein n=1 Tax=Candidatus Methanocrinis natronophilus TaxID=3033396 RepID=A0ABT5X6B7_9EURY|nr:hypothetical protein [Candidatus Methanocrinis natronophilus]MDF0590235.1 hypothetical protein [Candidatus Methanocrinis natronophilus]
MDGFSLAVYIRVSAEGEPTELMSGGGGRAYFTNMSADLENIFELNLRSSIIGYSRIWRIEYDVEEGSLTPHSLIGAEIKLVCLAALISITAFGGHQSNRPGPPRQWPPKYPNNT